MSEFLQVEVEWFCLIFFFSKYVETCVFQVKLILDTVDILQRYNWALFQLSFIWTAELGPS